MVTSAASGTGIAQCPLKFVLTFSYDSNNNLTGCSVSASGFGTYSESGTYRVENYGTSSPSITYI